jgi:hypothetical protein
MREGKGRKEKKQGNGWWLKGTLICLVLIIEERLLNNGFVFFYALLNTMIDFCIKKKKIVATLQKYAHLVTSNKTTLCGRKTT